MMRLMMSGSLEWPGRSTLTRANVGLNCSCLLLRREGEGEAAWNPIGPNDV